METDNQRTRRLARLLALALAMLTGCVGGVPAPDLGEVGASGSVVPRAIELQTVGGPTDTSGDDPVTLTLADATRRLLATDPGIQAALARLQATRADAEQARLLPNPILSVTIRPRLGPESAIITPAISEDVVAFLERPQRTSAADNRLRAAAADTYAAVVNALSDLQERYVDVQTADQQLAVLAERRKLLERLGGIARARLKGGEGIGLDVTAVETRQLNLETDIAAKRIDRHSARLSLARLIGRPSAAADWQLAAWSPPSNIEAPQSQWLALAMRNRADLRSQRWELAALGNDKALAGLLPGRAPLRESRPNATSIGRWARRYRRRCRCATGRRRRAGSGAAETVAAGHGAPSD